MVYATHAMRARPVSLNEGVQRLEAGILDIARRAELPSELAGTTKRNSSGIAVTGWNPSFSPERVRLFPRRSVKRCEV